MYYIVVFWFGLSLITGLILGRKFFYSLIERTTSLLNAMLETDESDDVKQRLLIQHLGRLVITLLILILVISLITFISLLPGYLYVKLNHLESESLDYGSTMFYIILISSSTIPFILMKLLSKKKDYSEWSILFHRIIFNNYNISKGLFGFEKSLFKSKTKELNNRFIIVSGLARAGTTALTTLLHDTNQFHSLSYANMPLLLSPNFWRKFYHPKSDELRERSHGDRVMFGHNTVEALEEFFWTVHLKNEFVTSDTLNRHEVSKEIYQQYLIYQSLIKQSNSNETIYLAKNNNFILRYNSLRKLNADFVIVILFRDPLEHAYSLLNQHQRYTKFQTEDAFIKEYMGWLGHYEFGLSHKHFDFSTSESLKEFDEYSINYWLRIWIDYYTYIAALPEDRNLVLVNYKDFLNSPEIIVKGIGNKLNVVLRTDAISRFDNEKTINFDGDDNLKSEAYAVHQRLLSRKNIL
ncbi:MAG: sulfotransferase family protein [Chryseolinea sp.]